MINQKWKECAKELGVEIIKVYNGNKVKVRNLKNPDEIKIIPVLKLTGYARNNKKIFNEQPDQPKKTKKQKDKTSKLIEDIQPSFKDIKE